MYDSLQLQSSCGANRLLGNALCISKESLKEYYSLLRKTYGALYECETEGVGAHLAALKHRLMCLRDISGTLQRLQNGVVLQDIELFEVKYLALLTTHIGENLRTLALDWITLPQLKEVVAVLDPDGLCIENFYIYDSYSEELADVRRQIKKHQELSGAENTSDELLELLERERALEAQIREGLSGELKGSLPQLREALDSLGDLDILLAKCLQIKMLGLTIPEISEDGNTEYCRMFHPHIVQIYTSEGGRRNFTPIDIRFGLEPLTIIGANMGGKSVVLKMVALNQILFQFGFGVAASQAKIDIKERVLVCMGDQQSEVDGLSSFAGEVRAIESVLKSVREGERVLALIDEPARTTNPIEGTALVTALLEILKGRQLSALITTHYNLEGNFFRRLKVKGLKDGRMDYTLVETKEGEIPQEAINVARSLNADSQWCDMAEKILHKK